MSGRGPDMAVQLAAWGNVAGGWFWFAHRCIEADGESNRNLEARGAAQPPEACRT